MPDIRGKAVNVGDHVVTALREGNVAALRVGVVENLLFQTEPYVTQTPEVVEAPPEEVAVVKWISSSQAYLPVKSTKVPTAKVVRVEFGDDNDER